MNDRIQELADEAAKYSAVMALPTGQSGNELFVAKLAELIVAECMNVVAKKCASPTAYNALAEHWEVEE